MAHDGSSVPLSDAPGVALRVAELGRRGPGLAARDGDDVRASIRYAVRELAPWELRFDFLVYTDDKKPGESEYELAGFALERPIRLAEANASPDTARMTSHHYSTFLAGFTAYRRIAELRLRFRNDEANARHVAMTSDRPHRDHELLVDEYRSREGSKSRILDMAVDLGCHRTTIYRKLREAVSMGLISESEIKRR